MDVRILKLIFIFNNTQRTPPVPSSPHVNAADLHSLGRVS